MIPTLSGSILPAISPPVFPPSNFANKILNTMQGVTTGWVLLVMPTAQKLFLDLAGLEVCWSMGEFILQKAQSGWEALAIATAKKILQLSIFFWIVSNANTLFWVILNLFQSTAATLTGVPVLSPGTILQTGVNFVSLIHSNIPWAAMLSPPVTFTVAFSSLLLLLSYVIVAGQFMVTIVESYVATSAGILMLGFAGSRFTAQFADKYFAYAIGVGIKLLMCSVVVALGEGISTDLSSAMATPGFFTISNGAIFSNLAELVGISLIYAFMAWYIPQLASSLASGSVGMTLGAFMATGASLVGSMFAASKLGGAAVLGGLGKLKGAAAAGGGGGPSPLSGLSKLTMGSSSGPSYVPPPGGSSAASSGGAPPPPSEAPSPGPPGGGPDTPGGGEAGSGPGSGNSGSGKQPSGAGSGTPGETPSAAPKFSDPSGAFQTTPSSGSPGSSSRAPSMPSDKADVSAGGPQFKHGEGGE
ncbi:MAG: P-type conjugative transfer protein TrbL [Leptospirales bacterium]